SNPASVFISGSGQGSGLGLGGAAQSNSLLTLTTLSQRIQADDLTDPNQSGTPAMQPPLPQSGCAVVRYDLDPQSGMLTRIASSVPNLQTLMQMTPGPDDLLAPDVVNLKLSFWDPNQSAWRDDWDFEQQQQAQQQAQTPGQTGGQASGAGSAAGG